MDVGIAGQAPVSVWITLEGLPPVGHKVPQAVRAHGLSVAARVEFEDGEPKIVVVVPVTEQPLAVKVAVGAQLMLENVDVACETVTEAH